MATYEVGDRVSISTTTVFQDSDGTPFDPDTITFEVKAPGGSTVSYVYGTDSNVTKAGTGDYKCAIDVDTAGRWHYYIIGETSGGENRGADQGSFEVRRKTT